MRIQEQLLLDRDPHGNVQVSLIETERLFMETVTKELEERKKNGTYKGKFNPLQHFFGYEGRSGFPSNFDCNYCYALGTVAALLIEQGFTGYMSSLRDLTKSASDWKVGAVPITMMMHLEKRHGILKPVIEKALVDLKGKPFAHFQSQRDKWIAEDAFVIPGPIQFFGDKELTEILSWTLELEC
jgi:pyrophosphate--fructose-6-phosphate 1-phosphotransferase